MKISKIPGLGRFGVFIDDLDFTNLSDEEWHDIGKLHLESLVTIIRNVNLTPIEYESWIKKWGCERDLATYRFVLKYKGADLDEILSKDVVNGVEVSQDDRDWALNTLDVLALAETEGTDTQIARVSGLTHANGRPLGMFQEGELLWHSNESGNLVFAPGVSLLGVRGVVGSATGFVTTTDWYEEQSESFRSELDEMIMLHKFTPGKINPGLRKEQDDIMYWNMCPEPTELPLVMQSPIGIKGLHYSINTINSIKGMSDQESQAVFEQINKTLFVEKYIYDHWYQQDNDLCLFDNSITLHRRLGGIAERLCYRIQYDFNKLSPNDQPYFQDPYKTEYTNQIENIYSVFGYE
jgi:alpha-ketoglutarate-dependent taurine dioxygenase